jgi:hypothetical protein
MNMKRIPTLIIVLAAAAAFAAAGSHPQASAAGPSALMPKFPEWKPTEAVRTFSPDSLFEYIDGAAEAYLGYDFRELAVGEYAATGAKTTVTAEIYDMGAALNAFGIYGAERYPESRFLPIGVQGYYEEGTLNFLAGRYYVKLLAFEAGEKGEEILTRFARAIVSGIKDVGAFPARLAVFPVEGRIANGERFLRRSVLGLKFLNNGYTAGYKKKGQEFDAYLIDCPNEAEAQAALKSLVEYFSGAGRSVASAGDRFQAKDPYLKNVRAVRSGAVLCLVTKLADGQEAAGEGVLSAMTAALTKR